MERFALLMHARGQQCILTPTRDLTAVKKDGDQPRSGAESSFACVETQKVKGRQTGFFFSFSSKCSSFVRWPLHFGL